MTGQAAGTGSIPATNITVQSDDSKYLFKRSLEASKHNTTPADMFAAVLQGSPNEVNSVAHQRSSNTREYDDYDPKLYSGRCAGAVDAFYAECDRKAEAEHKGTAADKEHAKGKGETK